jgi:hypothetical protein
MAITIADRKHNAAAMVKISRYSWRKAAATS